MLGDRRRLKVATIGAAVPEEVLVAARAEIVPVTGIPGEPTDLGDRYIEPMVGERARSQLQRVLDGSYGGADLLLFSREAEASLRLFLALREVRRLEPGRGLPPLHLIDLQHLGTDATRRWNEARIRELCALLGVDDEALGQAIRECNAAPAVSEGDGDPRVYVTGSEHAGTGLTINGAVVTGPRVAVAEDGDPVAAVARRYEHPLLARARASTADRARAVVEDALAARADRVVAFYLEGDDGIRWEFPEIREALESVGIQVTLRDRQPFDQRGQTLDV